MLFPESMLCKCRSSIRPPMFALNVGSIFNIGHVLFFSCFPHHPGSPELFDQAPIFLPLRPVQYALLLPTHIFHILFSRVFPPVFLSVYNGTGVSNITLSTCHPPLLLICPYHVRGFAKLKKSRNPKKNLERAHTIQTFIVETHDRLTWTEHSNHNNQQLLAM